MSKRGNEGKNVGRVSHIPASFDLENMDRWLASRCLDADALHQEDTRSPYAFLVEDNESLLREHLPPNGNGEQTLVELLGQLFEIHSSLMAVIQGRVANTARFALDLGQIGFRNLDGLLVLR